MLLTVNLPLREDATSAVVDFFLIDFEDSVAGGAG